MRGRRATQRMQRREHASVEERGGDVGQHLGAILREHRDPAPTAEVEMTLRLDHAARLLADVGVGRRCTAEVDAWLVLEAMKRFGDQLRQQWWIVQAPHDSRSCCRIGSAPQPVVDIVPDIRCLAGHRSGSVIRANRLVTDPSAANIDDALLLETMWTCSRDAAPQDRRCTRQNAPTSRRVRELRPVGTEPPTRSMDRGPRSDAAPPHRRLAPASERRHGTNAK